MFKNRTVQLSSLFVILISASVLGAEFGDLLSRVPPAANAIMLIDVEQLLQSPLAKKEGSKKAYEEKYHVTPILLPPDAKRFVLAAYLPLPDVQAAWEVAVMERSLTPTMAKLARLENGHVDELAGVKVVRSAYDAYFVKFSNHLMGIISPASRQNAKRWIEQSGAWKGGPLSGYLQKAVGLASTRPAQVVMAIDLEDAPDFERVKGRIGSFRTLENRDVDLDTLARLICSIKGLTFAIHVTDHRQGTMTIEFGLDAAPLGGFLKPFLIESLELFEIALKDFDAWTASVSGNTVTFEGPMSKSGMSFIASLLEMPSPSDAPQGLTAEQIRSTDPGAATSVAQASQTYFQSVNELLIAVNDHPRSSIWMKKTASRIDRQPVLNVDPELLDYSGQVSYMLREGAATLGQRRLKADARSAAVQPDGGYYAVTGVRGRYRRHGYAYYSSNYGEHRRIQSEERLKGVTAANEILREIGDMTVKIRAEMAGRYQLGF